MNVYSEKYVKACNNLSEKSKYKELANKVAEMLTYYDAECGECEDKAKGASVAKSIRRIMKRYTKIGEYVDKNNMFCWCFIDISIPNQEQRELNDKYVDMTEERQDTQLNSL